MKKHNVKILPILSNADFRSHSGNFSGELLDKVLRNQEKKEQLINDIVKYLATIQTTGC